MFIWLASYPKSGNTWLRVLLESLKKGGAAVDINALSMACPQAAMREPFDNALGVSSSDLTITEIDFARPFTLALEASESPRLLYRKVHDAWRCNVEGLELFPKNLTHTAFYVVRDPRDVAVSSAHHSGVSIDRTIAYMADDTCTLSASGKSLSHNLPQILLSWSRHVESWLDQSGQSPLLLRYEDMLVNPVASARAVCERLGWAVDETLLQSAVSHTRFDRLAGQEKIAGFSERAATDRPFFREGKAGGWKDRLSRGQIQRVERDHGTVMTRLGYL